MKILKKKLLTGLVVSSILFSSIPTNTFLGLLKKKPVKKVFMLKTGDFWLKASLFLSLCVIGLFVLDKCFGGKKDENEKGGNGNRGRNRNRSFFSERLPRWKALKFKKWENLGYEVTHLEVVKQEKGSCAVHSVKNAKLLKLLLDKKTEAGKDEILKEMRSKEKASEYVGSFSVFNGSSSWLGSKEIEKAVRDHNIIVLDSVEHLSVQDNLIKEAKGNNLVFIVNTASAKATDALYADNKEVSQKAAIDKASELGLYENTQQQTKINSILKALAEKSTGQKAAIEEATKLGLYGNEQQQNKINEILKAFKEEVERGNYSAKQAIEFGLHFYAVGIQKKEKKVYIADSLGRQNEKCTKRLCELVEDILQ